MRDDERMMTVWHCVRCGRPITTWQGGASWMCPGCHAQGAWAGDKITVPEGVLVVGAERDEKNQSF